MNYEKFIVYTVDTQEEADKVNCLVDSKEKIFISEKGFQDLKSGKIIVWCDDNTSHQIKLMEDDSNE